MKQSWQLQEAKNRFSEVVKKTEQAPQIITRHGRPVAVIQSYASWSASKEEDQGGLAKWLRNAPKSKLSEIIEDHHDELREERVGRSD